MILFNDVVEVFPPDHIDWDRTTKALEHLVDRFDASCIGTTLVDDDLAWQSVHLKGSVANLAPNCHSDCGSDSARSDKT